MAERHESDYSKSSKQILLDLINHDNGTSLQEDQVQLVNLTPAETGNQVTVTVQSALGSGFKGDIDMVYNRIDLLSVPLVRDREQYVTALTGITNIVSFISTHFGLMLQAEDVDVVGDGIDPLNPLVVQEYDVLQSFEFVAKASSLVWYGAIPLTIKRTGSPGADVWLIGYPGDIQWPDAPVATGTDGNVRMRPDGSVRIMAV